MQAGRVRTSVVHVRARDEGKARKRAGQARAPRPGRPCGVNASWLCIAGPAESGEISMGSGARVEKRGGICRSFQKSFEVLEAYTAPFIN